MLQNQQQAAQLAHKPQQKKNPDPSTSQVYAFTNEQIELHIKSLAKPLCLKPSVIRHKCSPVLRKVMESDYGWIFNEPVDPVKLKLPDYFEVIKQPMDLGTVRKKLENSSYREVKEFTDDVSLVFDNAIHYNGPHGEVTDVAKKMKKMFEGEWKRVHADMSHEEETQKQKGDTCALCSMAQLQFEPAAFYCNGAACNMQRIRRNSYYYEAPNRKYHWCHVCFADLREGQVMDMGDCQFTKAELNKKKNDEQHEEPWVGCDECPRWVHQICALFNGRKNHGENTVYHCPFCVQQTRTKLGLTEGTVKTKGAKEIAHTRASAYIERRVRECVEVEQKRLQEEDGVSFEDVPKTGGLFARQLSNRKDKSHNVRPRMQERYEGTDFPTEFPVTSKCIVLFEEIDGVDVILFGMYLYEYGHRTPQPNHRRVYVSYLDSVHYFRPKAYRTMVYHQMLVAYTAYAKARGFHTCYIWACPPLKGDDYIFHIHPEEQKTPKEDRLRNWYLTMLDKCKEEGSVIKVSNMYDEHFTAPDAKATDVPYFEGDYWIAEAEGIIKNLEEEKEARAKVKAEEGEDAPVKIPPKKKTKDKKATGRGLRSDGDVEELSGRDPLVVRMGKTLEPMKDKFLVAHLHPREFVKEKWEQRLREIEVEKAEDARAAAAGGGGGADSTLDTEGDGEGGKSGADAAPPDAAIKAANTGKSSSSKMMPSKSEKTTAPAPVSSSSVAAAAAPAESGEAAAAATAAPSGVGAPPPGVTAGTAGGETTAAAPTPEAGSVKIEESSGDAPATATAAETTGGVSEETPPVVKTEEPPETAVAASNGNGGTESTPPEAPPEAPAPVSSSSVMDIVKQEGGNGEVKAEPADSSPSTANGNGDAAPSSSSSSSSSSEAAAAAVVKSEPTPGGENGAAEGAAGSAAVKAEDAAPSDPAAVEAKAVEDKATAEAEAMRKLSSDPSNYPDYPPPTDELDDMDAEQASDFFDTRQEFLNLCTQNHYQFDSLRRSKHTSMMTLFHVHNPDIPKVQTVCNICSEGINSGYKYDCEQCPDFHLCHKCFTHYGTAAHHHRLKREMVQSDSALTAEQRRQRQRSIQLHMQLLAHASICHNAACPSANCQKMKNLLQHGTKCPIKVQGGCNVCRRIWALLQIHARQCRRADCQVPKCRQLKQQLRNIELQQHAMDERRRVAMNEQYGAGRAAAES